MVVWEVREITSGERGSRATSGETRRGEKHGGAGRRERGSLRGHPCQPGDGHFAKNFRFVCTRRSEPGGTTNTDVYARHAAPLRTSSSLSHSVHPRFILRRIRSRKLFGTRRTSVSLRLRLAKIHNGVGARPTTRGSSTSVDNDASAKVFQSLSLSRLICQIAQIPKVIESKHYLHAQRLSSLSIS